MNLVLTGKFGGPASFPQKQNLNNGQSRAVMGMPQKFYGADGGGSFSMGRKAFLSRTKSFRLTDLDSATGWSSSQTTIHNRIIHTGNGKGNNVVSSDQHIQRKKNNAIGRGSTKAGLASDALISFRSQDTTSRNNALTRCRAGGCTAPAKKGAISNPFQSGGGSVVT